MYPVFRDNDFVVVKKMPPDLLRKGNILVYRGDGGCRIIHRLIKKERGNILCLRGDGYNLPLERVTADRMIGKAVGLVRNRRYRSLSRSRELFSWLVSSLKNTAKQWKKRFVLAPATIQR